MKNIYLKKGINFECQGSSNCCVSRGSYGYVYLNNKDLKRFSNFFKIKINNFINKYCSKRESYLHLKEIKKNGNCIFLKDKKCSVYKARPEQCRTWPFWPENMYAKTWKNDLLNFCPGIGKGRYYSSKEIKKILIKDINNNEKIINN